MLAQSFVTTTLAVCAALVSVGAAVVVLSKTPVGRLWRWFARHVAEDRAREFHDRVLNAVSSPQVVLQRKREIRDVLSEDVLPRLQTLEAELSINGGKSTKDAVNRIAEKVGATEDPK